MSEEIIEAYWKNFLSTLPTGSPYHSKSYTTEGWGHSLEIADEPGQLIVSGVKTATCSSLWEWEAEGEPPPEPGAITIVLNCRDEPIGVIETTEVTLRRYNKVNAEFARGEGDLSLEYW